MAEIEIEEYDIDIDDLAEALVTNIKEDIKSFDDLVSLESALDREIPIGEITNGLGPAISAYIEYWNKKDALIPMEKRQPIKLIIDSPGGFLTDSLTIIDAIKLSKTPVIGVCTGCAYSGGFFIFIACDKRIAYPHASFLFHEGSAGNSGTSSQFQNYAAFYKKQLDQLKDIVLENTTITEDEYKDIKKDDIWYDAKEAMSKGIVDEIAEGFSYEV